MATDIGMAMAAVMANIGKGSTTVPSLPNTPATRPALVDREADYTIPALVFTAWVPEHGLRPIRRALTDRERSIAQVRSRALTSGLRPLVPCEHNIVRSALHGMFGGFRSMRQTDDNAEMAVEVLLHVLREFPAWAIEEASIRIATNQTDLSDVWPPNDAQIYAVVSGIVAPYRKALVTVNGILAAPIEPPPVKHVEPPLPTREEMAAQAALLAQQPQERAAKPAGDGNHMGARPG